MPVFRQGETPPAWCELSGFAVVDLAAGEQAALERRDRKERLLATRGSFQVLFGTGSQVIREGQFLDLPAKVDSWTIRAARDAQVAGLSGRWGDELGGCGIFRAVNEASPSDSGDPVAYPKTTSIDSHYHDCDEYWIVLEGGGTVVVGDRRYEVTAGDCVPIGLGHHHDLPAVTAPVKAVYFETTLEGGKRVGHLWNHTHGLAKPRAERI
jgi:mannose-6-phosphate isomerase-like protein (cupin superfamily)